VLGSAETFAPVMGRQRSFVPNQSTDASPWRSQNSTPAAVYLAPLPEGATKAITWSPP
jgi:hypothetical protein